MYGYLTKPGLTYSDVKKTDLSKLSLIELRDILERQDTLLRNGKFINSLPDKGQKIRDYRQKVQEKLKSKELVEETTSILGKLNLNHKFDLQHPMGSDSSEILKSHVDPYAKVLSECLDGTAPKTKFVPSKSKGEGNKKESSGSTPESLKMNEDKNSKLNETPIKVPQQSPLNETITMDQKPSISKVPTNQTSKSRADHVLEKYKDTGLAYGTREIQLQELSVDESLAFSKKQIEKEKQVDILRRVDKMIRFFENSSQESICEEADYEGESDDEKGTSVVFQYMK